MKKVLFAAAILVAILVSSSLAAEPVLSKDRRMVFLGDSITEQRIYTRFVIDYFTLRYPNLNISFRNAGWGGDTATGGLERLNRDVLSLHPDVVSICFGMNDAGYVWFDEEKFVKYMTGMKGLIAELKKANVKVVLLTPGCVDPDRNPNLKGYNDTLQRFAQGVMTWAKEENVPVFDVHELMLDVQTRAKKDDPNFTMIPDGVHPNDAGHIVMAYGLIKALGCTNQPSSLTIDAKGRVAPVKCKVTNLNITDKSLSFIRKDESLPMYFTPDAQRALRYLPFLDDLSKYMFIVTGLKDGNWKLVVDDIQTGTFASAELAQGVNLTMYPGPWQKLGEQVDNLAWNQEQMYFIKWREFEVGSLADDAKKMLSASVCPQMDDVISKWEQKRQAVVKSREWAWKLTLVE